MNPLRRKTIRLRAFDYATPGIYFVTICTRDRRLVLGQVADMEVVLSHAGRIVEQTWLDLPRFYPAVVLENFVVMPNHLHGLVALREPLDSAAPPPRPHTLSDVVRGFKSMSSRAVGTAAGGSTPLWQRGFYERIVRNEAELARIRDYIDTNPIAWANDPENPERAAVARR